MKHVDLSTEFGEAVPQFLDERLDPFRTAFTEPTWRHASVLAMGALLAPGKRTVSSCPRTTGNAECDYAQHWFDLDCLNVVGIARNALKDRPFVRDVAKHKQYFFS